MPHGFREQIGQISLDSSLFLCDLDVYTYRTPSFLLRWSDDCEIVHYDDKFSPSMTNLRRLAEYFIAVAEQLTDVLMLGVDPLIDLKDIKGDLGSPFYNTQAINVLANAHQCFGSKLADAKPEQPCTITVPKML